MIWPFDESRINQKPPSAAAWPPPAIHGYIGSAVAGIISRAEEVVGDEIAESKRIDHCSGNAVANPPAVLAGPGAGGCKDKIVSAIAVIISSLKNQSAGLRGAGAPELDFAVRACASPVDPGQEAGGEANGNFIVFAVTVIVAHTTQIFSGRIPPGTTSERAGCYFRERKVIKEADCARRKTSDLASPK